MQGKISLNTNDIMGLTFDALPSHATGLVVALTHAGGTLLVWAERLMGAALILVDTWGSGVLLRMECTSQP